MKSKYDLDSLANAALIAELERLVRTSHQATAEIIAHIAEVDRRKLYLDHACSSMFVYCTRRLRLSEQAAYRRIRVARAARELPEIFERLATGEVHLSGMSALVPRLNADNCSEMLAAARHSSTRDIEQLVADRYPKPDVPATVRRLPSAAVGFAQREAGAGGSWRAAAARNGIAGPFRWSNADRPWRRAGASAKAKAQAIAV